MDLVGSIFELPPSNTNKLDNQLKPILMLLNKMFRFWVTFCTEKLYKDTIHIRKDGVLH